MREIARGELRAPALVLDIDVARSGPTEPIDVERFKTVFCLVRNDGVAVATRFLDIDNDATLTPAAVRDLITASPLPEPAENWDAFRGSITVVICTRDRNDRLLTALSSLGQQSDSDFDVLVIDNSRDGTVVRSWQTILAHGGIGGLRITCKHEPAAGLSRARNRGLYLVDTDFIAWIDDDEVADRGWVAWMKRGLAMPERPDALAGVMLPAELETEAQVNFERYGGFNKGRGMEPVRLRAGTPAVMDPLYPLPSFGAGGNMVFRTAALRAIGGFDTRLGAGTLTQGGEETKALSLLLEGGSMILHWPPAVTWHYHRRTDEDLERQFFGYSAGLTAFFMSLILSSPGHIFRMLRFIPRGLVQIQANRNGDSGPDSPPSGFPDELIKAGRRGLFQGAWLFLRECFRQRHFGRASAGTGPIPLLPRADTPKCRASHERWVRRN